MDKFKALIDDEKKRLAEKGIQGTIEEHKTWLKNTMKKLFGKQAGESKKEASCEPASIIRVRAIFEDDANATQSLQEWQSDTQRS
jgi:hypothetical protein